MRDYVCDYALVIAYIYVRVCVYVYIYILYFSKKRKQITRPNWRHRGQTKPHQTVQEASISLSSIAHFPSSSSSFRSFIPFHASFLSQSFEEDESAFSNAGT